MRIDEVSSMRRSYAGLDRKKKKTYPRLFLRVVNIILDVIRLVVDDLLPCLLCCTMGELLGRGLEQPRSLFAIRLGCLDNERTYQRCLSTREGTTYVYGVLTHRRACAWLSCVRWM